MTGQEEVIIAMPCGVVTGCASKFPSEERLMADDWGSPQLEGFP